MDEDQHHGNPDRLLSEPPAELPDNTQSQDRQTGNMSSLPAGAPGNPTGDDIPSTSNGGAAAAAAGSGDYAVTTAAAPPGPAQVDPNAKAVHDVVNSEVGLQIYT